MNIRQDIYDLGKSVITHRRWFHMYPELDFKVKKTREHIIHTLTSLEFDSVEVFAGGVRGVIYGDNANSTLAFRADMDALELQEKTGVAFESSIEGRMHACGHDGHMAMLLGLAEWASQNRDDLKHNIVLIFQPAEETIGGALPMIEEKVLKDPDVDCIFAFHIFPHIEQGKIGLKAGPLMAQTTEFDIELEGKTSHGAMPHKGIDTIVAASHLIVGLQSLLTRGVDPLEDALITIGRLDAGERRNILAETAIIEGIIRTFDDNVYRRLKQDIINMLKGIELSYGVKGVFKELTYYPVVCNDRELVYKLWGMIEKEVLVDTKPLMIAEDFSYYQREVPGVLMLLGSRNAEKGYIHPLHSNKFNFDEKILLMGIQTMVDIISYFAI